MAFVKTKRFCKRDYEQNVTLVQQMDNGLYLISNDPTFGQPWNLTPTDSRLRPSQAPTNPLPTTDQHAPPLQADD